MGNCGSRGTPNIKRNDSKKLMRLLKEFMIDKYPRVDGNYTLKLTLDVNKEGVHHFLKSAQELKFDNMRKLFIFGMDFLTEEGIRDCNRFLTYSMPKKLSSLYLHGYNMDANKIKEGLTSVSGKVTQQIFLDWLIIDQTLLKVSPNASTREPISKAEFHQVV
jgi:hypothetical protein